VDVAIGAEYVGAYGRAVEVVIGAAAIVEVVSGAEYVAAGRM
jgi:hypothetical protein